MTKDSQESGDELTARLARQIDFILEIDKLKHVMRQSYLLDTSRKENDAEHAWHLAVMAMVLHEYAAEPGTDLRRVLEMVLVHDLVEIDAGDTFLYDTEATRDKAEREQAAADRLFALLPADQAEYMRGLWEEFEAGETPASRFARSLDRIAPFLLNYNTQGRMWHENNVPVERVREKCIDTWQAGSPVLAAYLRGLIDDAEGRGYFAARQQEEAEV